MTYQVCDIGNLKMRMKMFHIYVNRTFFSYLIDFRHLQIVGIRTIRGDFTNFKRHFIQTTDRHSITAGNK